MPISWKFKNNSEKEFKPHTSGWKPNNVTYVSAFKCEENTQEKVILNQDNSDDRVQDLFKRFINQPDTLTDTLMLERDLSDVEKFHVTRCGNNGNPKSEKLTFTKDNPAPSTITESFKYVVGDMKFHGGGIFRCYIPLNEFREKLLDSGYANNQIDETLSTLKDKPEFEIPFTASIQNGNIDNVYLPLQTPENRKIYHMCNNSGFDGWTLANITDNKNITVDELESVNATDPDENIVVTQFVILSESNLSIKQTTPGNHFLKIDGRYFLEKLETNSPQNTLEDLLGECYTIIPTKEGAIEKIISRDRKPNEYDWTKEYELINPEGENFERNTSPTHGLVKDHIR